jgi:hypothetical protein
MILIVIGMKMWLKGVGFYKPTLNSLHFNELQQKL